MVGGKAVGCLPRDGEGEAQRAPGSGATGTPAEGAFDQGANATQAGDLDGTGDLRPTEVDRGTGVRPDQTGPGVHAVSAQRDGKNGGGVGVGLPDAQSAEVLEARLGGGRMIETKKRNATPLGRGGNAQKILIGAERSNSP